VQKQHRTTEKNLTKHKQNTNMLNVEYFNQYCAVSKHQTPLVF